jgi:sugar O-acyltransferase (sialic acid O-acetyltransferase NeuD family)
VTRVVVAGAGGHSRSVIEALRSTPEVMLVGCTDPDIERHGNTLDGVPILGDDDLLERLLRDGQADTAAIGLGGAGDNGPRRRLFGLVRDLGFALPPVVSPAAFVASTATLGAGTVVLPGAVVGSGAIIGDDVIINCAAIVEHDCRIGDHAHVASGAVLGGTVAVDVGAHVGLGASVRPATAIGAGALVAVGAVVVDDVAPGSTVMGVPARTH